MGVGRGRVFAGRGSECWQRWNILITEREQEIWNQMFWLAAAAEIGRKFTRLGWSGISNRIGHRRRDVRVSASSYALLAVMEKIANISISLALSRIAATAGLRIEMKMTSVKSDKHLRCHGEWTRTIRVICKRRASRAAREASDVKLKG